MDVILLERVAKLGLMGEVVKVKPGFARNFLLPKKKALRATAANKAKFETQRAQLEANNLAQRQEAEKVAARMGDVSVLVIRQAGDSGQLYGSVSARDISDAVTAAGYTVSRSQVALDIPIKALGTYPIQVALHPEVEVTVTVNVARSQEEMDRAALNAQAEAEAEAEMRDMASEAAAARAADGPAEA